jgi:hypothetical protein
MIDEFGLEGVKKLSIGALMLIGPAAHRSLEAGGLHHVSILRRGVLSAAISMVN